MRSVSLAVAIATAFFCLTARPAAAQLVEGAYGIPEYDRNWGLYAIYALDAHQRGYTGKGVKVGVVDSGLDVNHPEFIGQLDGYSFDFHIQGPALGDPNGHGTHVGGIIAAALDGVGTVGVAPGADLVPLRLLDASGHISFGDLPQALADLYGGAVADGVRLFNNSWGSVPTFPAWSSAYVASVYGSGLDVLRDAVARDSLLVWATGNHGSNEAGLESALPYFFPELRPGWIAVTAVRPDGDLTSYANACGVAALWCIAAPGGEIYLSADGTIVVGNIYSTWPTTDPWYNGYRWIPGTSMAAPHVTGAAAIAREMFPNASWAEIGQIVLRTALDFGDPGIDPLYGWGLLDLDALTMTVHPSGSALFGNAAWAREATVSAASGVVSARLNGRRLMGAAPLGEVTGSVDAGGDGPVGSPAPVFWAQGVGSSGAIDGDWTRPGAKASAGGALVGLEAQVLDRLVVGLAGGLTTTDLEAELTGDEASATGLHGLAYLGFEDGPWFVNAVAGASRFSQSYTRRYIPGSAYTVLGGYGLAGRSETEDWVFNLDFEAGYGFRYQRLLAEPFAHASWVGQRTGSDHETGGDIFSLALHDSAIDRGDAGVGLRLALPSVVEGFTVTPLVSASYGRAFGDERNGIDVSLLGTSIAAETIDTGRNVYRVSAELHVGTETGKLSGFVGYSGEFRDGGHANAISAGLTLRF